LAQNQEDDLKLIETYFNAAVDSKDDAYFELREKVLQYGEEALPFLQKASEDERLMARVIARAWLAWLAEPYSKTVRSGDMKSLHQLLNTAEHGLRLNALSGNVRINDNKSSFHVYYRIARNLQSVLTSHGGFDSTLLDWARTDKPMRKQNAYLLEAALKGFPPQWRRQVHEIGGHGYVHQLARCYAAALSGHCTCKDTPDVLGDLLKSDISSEVRMGAAIGLELTGKKTVAIPNLTQALTDESPDVRLVTFGVLRRLTGDRLDAPEFFLGEIEPHHIAAAEKWWAENKERVQREQSERPSYREEVEEPPPELTPEEMEQLMEQVKRMTEEELKQNPVRRLTEEEEQQANEEMKAFMRKLEDKQRATNTPVDSTEVPTAESN
jgi:hypothetical protein